MVNFCQDGKRECDIGMGGDEQDQKDKRAANLRSLLPGLYPPPGTSPNRTYLRRERLPSRLRKTLFCPGRRNVRPTHPLRSTLLAKDLRSSFMVCAE